MIHHFNNTLPQRIYGPVAVFGDVHGEKDRLDYLLNKIKKEGYLTEDRWIVFLGDIVDHYGRKQKETIETVIELTEKHKCTACLGNHDLGFGVAIGAIDYLGRKARVRDTWATHKYSRYTFSSYGCNHMDWFSLMNRVPFHHKKFINMMPWCVEHPDYIFVHSGLVPDQTVWPSNHEPQQCIGMPKENGLQNWPTIPDQLKVLRNRDNIYRNPWLHSFNIPYRVVNYPKIVVSGHLNVPDVLVVKSVNNPRHGRIMVDTGAGLGGKLSVVMLPELVTFSI